MENLLSLKGKVALVTGASQGQGAAEAELFARHGATVVLSDIADAAGLDHASALQMPYVHLDVSNETHWATAVDHVLTTLGRLDILVNNAGISYFNHIAETDAVDFTRVLEVNTTGIFLGMKHVHPAMKATGGSIVNVASISALTGREGLAGYAASKWAVRGLSRSAALDFAPDHIRVNTVFPGLVDTPMTRSAYGDQRMSERGRALPVGRAGAPTDIANLVLFLSSDAAGFINGGEFVIDGGETAGQRTA